MAEPMTSLGWVLVDPVTKTKARRKVGYGYHERQSTKVYASKAVAERYVQHGQIAVEVFANIP